MIDIGSLNKRITFKRYTESENEWGQTVQSLTDYRTIWASVEPLTGKEYLDAQRNVNEQIFKIYTRYFKDLRDVNLIINYQGRKFTIQSVIDYRENHEMLLFMCTERIGETFE
jgi:SPP1 family predicted phage head-tail adaptor